MVPVVIRSSILDKIQSTERSVPLNLVKQGDNIYKVTMKEDADAKVTENGSKQDFEAPLDSSWPKYSRHGNASSPSYQHSGSYGPSGTPPQAGTPTNFKIVPPYNSPPLKLRHFMRPDTSLPFDKDTRNSAEDFLSELQSSYSPPPDGSFPQEKGVRMKTALKMEGEQDMTSMMMEKYTHVTGARPGPIRHLDSFIGFNESQEETSRFPESILICDEREVPDSAEFEIPNGLLSQDDRNS